MISVVHVIHDLRPGGAEHLLVDLAAVAPSAGIDMSVVSLRPLAGHRHARALARRGVPVDSLDLAAWWDPRGPGRFAALLERRQPDVVHTHLKHADVIGGRAAVRAGIPHVSTLHVIEDGIGRTASWKRDLAVRFRQRTAHRTIAVSDAVRDWYMDHTGADPASVVTIRNGVPAPPELTSDERSSVRSELGVGSDAVMAVMVAVMRPGKGHDVLLDAIAGIDDPRLVLVLAGDGPLEPEIRRRAASDERVVLAGFRDDVDRLLAAADMVVHPTLADALPTALVHALAAGTPTVASDVGGVPEIVAPGTGVLVPPGDRAALTDAVAAMASDPEGRRVMGKRARERFEEEFAGTDWARRLRALYEEIVAAD